MKNDYKEINELLKKAQNNNEDAKLKLVENLSPLIKSSIKKYCPLYDYFDDLYQDGVLIILESLDFYDEKKANYLAMIKAYLKYHYLETYKYIKKRDVEVSAFQENVNLYDLVESDENIEIDFLIKEADIVLQKALEKITKREREVIYLYYYKRYSHKKIAEILNISKWTVVNNKRRGISKLKEVYNVN